MTTSSETVPVISAGAQRMRQHRLRRQNGLRCVVVQVRQAEVSELTRLGLLPAEQQTDRNAIAKALHQFLDAHLQTPWYAQRAGSDAQRIAR